ncbi:MAG: carboxymuconolactone decarboxylase family protein, partial [Halocynthiibacter sp.]
QRYGATPARLADIWAYETSPHFTTAEKAAFDFTLAAAQVPNLVDEAISARLREHWTDDEIVEILGVISLFGFLNRWNDSMGTTMEDGAVAAGETWLAPSGWSRGKHR